MAIEFEPNTKTSATSSVLLLLPSFILHKSKSAAAPPLIHLLRHVVLISIRLLILILSPLLRLRSYSPSSSSSSSAEPTSTGSTPSSRALSHVLSVVSRVPVASRKYELVRSLADRLLDDNLSSSSSLNRDALSSAFSRTLRALESCVAASAKPEGFVSLDLIVRAARRWIGEAAAAEERTGVAATFERAAAEKMAAEVMWLAVKMEECGALEEAVVRWGEATVLASLALVADPRIQVAFVRVSAFLFKHANAKQFRRKGEGNYEEKECIVSGCRMAMLTSWLPLLCRASNGTDAPIMSSGEKAEMVKVLEDMIEKLSLEQQEEVLALWLHHFTLCPDSDWPNLESCYTRWYSKSRDLVLFK